MRKNKHWIVLIFIIVAICEQGISQLSGMLRAGVNFGTINQDAWISSNNLDTFKYDQPLIRPIFGFGTQYRFSNNFFIRQEFLFQTKGQGSIRPDTWSLFNTYNKDILHFVSFPLSAHFRIFSQVYVGVAFQPSYYISGSDNYDAGEFWKGWVYGGTARVHGFIGKIYEVGIEYDHDFTLYYCGDCDIRFYTFRIYGAYHFFNQ